MTLKFRFLMKARHGGDVAVDAQLGRGELEVHRQPPPGLRFFDARMLRTVVATVGALLSPEYIPTATCFSTRNRWWLRNMALSPIPRLTARSSRMLVFNAFFGPPTIIGEPSTRTFFISQLCVKVPEVNASNDTSVSCCTSNRASISLLIREASAQACAIAAPGRFEPIPDCTIQQQCFEPGFSLWHIVLSWMRGIFGRQRQIRRSIVDPAYEVVPVLLIDLCQGQHARQRRF